MDRGQHCTVPDSAPFRPATRVIWLGICRVAANGFHFYLPGSTMKQTREATSSPELYVASLASGPATTSCMQL
jgi:hypothetical protein